MTPYGLPTAYTPAKPDPSPVATTGQRKLARDAGASHVAHDGYYCYRWVNGIVQSKQWYSDRYSMNWMDTGKREVPPGVVKVDD